MKFVLFLLLFLILLFVIPMFIHSGDTKFLCEISETEALECDLFFNSDSKFLIKETYEDSLLIMKILEQKRIDFSFSKKCNLIACKGIKLHGFHWPKFWKINYTYSTLYISYSDPQKIYLYSFDPFYRNVLIGEWPIKIFDDI